MRICYQTSLHCNSCHMFRHLCIRHHWSIRCQHRGICSSLRFAALSPSHAARCPQASEGWAPHGQQGHGQHNPTGRHGWNGKWEPKESPSWAGSFSPILAVKHGRGQKKKSLNSNMIEWQWPGLLINSFTRSFSRWTAQLAWWNRQAEWNRRFEDVWSPCQSLSTWRVFPFFPLQPLPGSG